VFDELKQEQWPETAKHRERVLEIYDLQQTTEDQITAISARKKK
jgi:hypothetical protein